MTDLLLQVGVSNLCISLVLAMAAWAVQRTGKRPSVVHLLWLLVLAKLVTPPLFTLPLVAIPGASVMGDVAIHGSSTSTAMPGDPVAEIATITALEFLRSGAVLLWLLGSACVLVWSLIRVLRFDRLLRMASEPASDELQQLAAQLAMRLGLSTPPTIHLTAAQLSPMVWWVGGAVRVFLPAALPREIDARQLRLIVAHELAHVRRRDHLVRWLEWSACVCFWWNPVVWWARRNLRANEEVCCDALVLERLHPNPHIYANSLLSVVEFLSSPVLRPPAMASEINSGGFLERRLKMIVSNPSTLKTPRWLHGAILLTALGLLPIGVAYAQNPDVEAVGRRLRSAVAAGELTAEQAKAMLGALPKPAKVDTRAVGVRLKAAVGAGELTAEQAQEMMAVLVRGADGTDPKAADQRAAKHYEDLAEAVKAGRLPKEEAQKKYLELKKQADRETASRGEPVDLAELRKKLGAAVESGRITKEVAQKKYVEFTERAARAETPRSDRDDLVEMRKKLGAAIESGRITEEAARAKMQEYLKRASRGEAPRAQQPDAEALRQRLKAAVEAGRMTIEEARAKFVELLKQAEAAKQKVNAAKKRTPLDPR